MEKFRLSSKLPEGVSPIINQNSLYEKHVILEDMKKAEVDEKNISQFWKGLAVRDNVGDTDTRFIAVQLPNGVFVYEWFNGSENTDKIYDYIDYQLRFIDSETGNKKEGKYSYDIVGYFEKDFVIKRNSVIKESMKRSTDQRKREIMWIKFTKKEDIERWNKVHGIEIE